LSTKTRVARCLCVLLAGSSGRIHAAPAFPGDDPPPVASAVSSGSLPGPPGGILLDRLSRRDVRTWRAIEGVVASSDASGGPRSPTLRRLWQWALATRHALYVEMAPPSRLAAGMAGVFGVERFDPAGVRYVSVIRLCPSNIQRARACPGPNAVQSFVRFAGLTDDERYAEVLAHELAHAEYLLNSPERLAEFQEAQKALEESVSRSRSSVVSGREALVRDHQQPLAVLEAVEAYAESLEAAVLQELSRRGPRADLRPRGLAPR
jgi:hypothetical protein